MKKSIASILLLVIALLQPLSAIPVHKGEKIKLILQEQLSSETSHMGDLVHFEVGDDVKVDDKVVIQKEAVAFGKISEVEPRRGLGRAGSLKISGLYVITIDGKKLKITFDSSDKPGGAAPWVIAGAFWVSWPLLFLKGNPAVIKKDTAIDAFLDENADVLSLQEKQQLTDPKISVVGGLTQSIRTSTFLLHAHIENAEKIALINVNGESVDFAKGHSIDVEVPIPVKDSNNEIASKDSPSSASKAINIPVILVMEDGSKLAQNVSISKNNSRPLKGKILKSDEDGMFINLGGLDGLDRNSCFVVYKFTNIRDASGKLIESIENIKGYVRVVEVFEKTAKVEPLKKETSEKIRVNDLIQ